MSKIALLEELDALGWTPMVARFQRSRWSRTRLRMDAMSAGEVLTLPLAEYYNAKASTDRLNDAYGGSRVWVMSRRAGVITIFYRETK